MGTGSRSALTSGSVSSASSSSSSGSASRCCCCLTGTSRPPRTRTRPVCLPQATTCSTPARSARPSSPARSSRSPAARPPTASNLRPLPVHSASRRRRLEVLRRGELHRRERGRLQRQARNPGLKALLVLVVPVVLVAPVLSVVLLVLEVGVLRRSLAVAGHHAGVAGTGLDVARAGQLDPEMPLVAVVEQEEELPPGRRVGHPQAASALVPPTGAFGVGDAGVLGGPVPRLAAEEERPQVVVVEVEGAGDGVPQVLEGLATLELDLAPDGRIAGTAEHADAEGIRTSRRAAGSGSRHGRSLQVEGACTALALT